MSNELTDVRCPCGAEFQADSYDAGFIAGSGMCQNCDAALPPKDICTCPSGDGSLRWPCPAHPAVEQAGGDERDFQAEGAQEVPSPVSQEYDRHLISLLRKGEALPGHQEEAADEIERLRDWNDHLNNTVLPNILNPNFLMLMKGGERLLDLCTKDGKFIGVSLNDMKDVFDWMVTHARIAPDHAALAQPSPAQAEQAEAERPEVVGYRSGTSGGIYADGYGLEKPEPLMTVAQHERIVGALRAEIAEWQEAAGRGRSDVVAYIAERAKLLEGRDAALARVAEMEAKLSDPTAVHQWQFSNAWFDGSEEVVLKAGKEGSPIRTLYTAPPAQAQQLHDLDKQCRDDVARALGLRPSQERGFAWSYLLASIKSCVKASGDSAQAQHSVPDGWVQSLPLKDHQPCKSNEDRANGYVIPIYSRPVPVEEALRKLRAVLCDPVGNVVIDGSDGDREEVQRALGILAAAPGKEVGHE
ncbi:hypothetical protein [Pseudomonas aeruginosa]|uniref:hypothetical protein n=1 Tax=Pseudomonas aeruginosa TaxID=287 RepID=UPI00235A3BCD|nr:hypothetical protein [Pseudomonas aeruginosa]